MKRWILILCAALLLCASCSKKETQPTASPQAAEQLEQGQKYLKEGKYEEAIEAFNQAVNFGEASADAYLGLYEAYMALEDMESAVYALETGYEATGDENIKTLYEARLAELGELYIEDDNYDGAADAYERLVKLDSTKTDYYLRLYDIYATLEDYEQSVNALERGYKATGDEDLKETWFSELTSQSQMLLDDGDYELAVTYLEKLLENGYEDAEVYAGLADAYSGLYEFEKALEVLAQAPDQEDSGIKRATAVQKIRYGEWNYDEGNTDTAISLLKEAVDIAPDEIEAYTILITIYMETDRLGEAGAIVESGVSRFMTEDSAADREELDSFISAAVDYYMTQEDLEASERFLETASKLRPDDEDFKDTLEGIRSMMADEAYAKAEELLEQGDSNGASVQFKKAFSLAPENFEEGLYAASNATYYLNGDGSYLTGWYEAEGGEKFYFNPAAGSTFGQAVTGWQEIDGSLYYFDEGGSMLMDDYAPDGRYVGLDGKLVEGGAPEEEEPEEAPEDQEEWNEEETAAEEETGSSSSGGSSSGSGSSGNTAGGTGSSGGSTGGGTSSTTYEDGSDVLTLNTDTLRRIQESGQGETVKSSEIFDISASQASLNDIYTSLKKYGMAVAWASDEAPYQLTMGDLTLWIQPGDGWGGSGVVVQDATQYRKALFAKALPEEFYVIVEFSSTSSSGSRVDIDRIERVNGQ